MAMTALTAQLPGVLPDLFRKPEQSSPRTEDATSQGASGAPASTTPSTTDDQRAQTMRGADDTTRMLARQAALGPLTYGRSTLPAAAPVAVPVGLRGVHLDVRG